MSDVGMAIIISMGVIFIVGVARLWYTEIFQCRKETLTLPK